MRFERWYIRVGIAARYFSESAMLSAKFIFQTLWTCHQYILDDEVEITAKVYEETVNRKTYSFNKCHQLWWSCDVFTWVP